MYFTFLRDFLSILFKNLFIIFKLLLVYDSVYPLFSLSQLYAYLSNAFWPT